MCALWFCTLRVIGGGRKIWDPVRDGVLARNEVWRRGPAQYELLVEGLENGEEQVKVTVP